MRRNIRFLVPWILLLVLDHTTFAFQITTTATATLPPAPSVKVSGQLRDKIVFVRADPKLGVSSLRILSDIESNTGANTGRHAAPDFQATSLRNARRNEINLMNVDGSEVSRLNVSGSDPMLSPDGTKIVYCSQQETLYEQIYVMNTDGTGQKKLTKIDSGDACGPAWSPDGKRILFYAFSFSRPSRNPEIWVMDTDGSNLKRLTDHGIDPSWSPDGKQIAFASHRDGLYQIYKMNSDGSNVLRLTKNNVESSNPAWAPDGGAIAYVSATADDRRGLFLMGPDGSDAHGLAHSKHEDFCFPTWSTDGRTIVFSALNRLGPQAIVVGEERPRCEQWSGEYQLFSLDADGKLHQISDAKLMATHPSYGRAVSLP